jgi:2-oxoglutarate dehydrogenase complex dehydrogenase (E1) component-like enzyme
VGRSASASTATGDHQAHSQELEEILERALR